MMKHCLLALGACLVGAPVGHGHPGHDRPAQPLQLAAATVAAADPAAAERIGGQGKFRFRYAAEVSGLPEEARGKLTLAHGGFAVDPQTGEVFFGLKGAGIVWMSGDLSEKRVLPVSDPGLLEGNFHNTTILRRHDGSRFLALPDNEKGRILIVSDEGEMVSSLASGDVNAYYASGGAFNPTDTEYADGKLYVADGYSAGNFILTADPWAPRWLPLVFGGKATADREYGLFGTAHGITLNPATRRLEISDRANSRIQSFDLQGTYLGGTRLPEGSLPCDVDFHGAHAVVGCLNGPRGETPAPFYILDQDGRLLSEVTPMNDFGLSRFTHIHNATWKPVRAEDGKLLRLYVLATAWNPGDFAVFELLKE